MTILIPKEVQTVLNDFEDKKESFNDYELHQAINVAFRPNSEASQELRNGWWAELSAFHFRICPTGEKSEWGTHFGPMMSATYEDGTRIERPDIKEIDQEIIDYWKIRAEGSKHPVCKARYADLVWDLSPLIIKKKENVRYAQTAIDAYRNSADLVTDDTRVQSIHNLERALELAITLNDSQRIEEVKKALFCLFDKIAQPGMDGTWPFLFDLLYDNKKVPISDVERDKIISSLEDILKKCSEPKSGICFSPWGAQAAAERLEKHYKNQNKSEDINRVIRTYGNSFEELSQKADSLVAMSWLQDVYESYKQHGLTADALRVQKQSKEKGKHAKEEMKTIVSEIKISTEEMGKLIAEFTKSDLDSALLAIPIHFIPRIDQITAHIENQKNEHPLQAMIAVTTIDDGQIVAKTGSVEDDPNGRLRLELAKQISVSTLFLSAVLEAVKAHFYPTVDQLTAYLFQSPLFDDDRKTLIIEGLKAYLQNDHLKFIHLMIPQIEHCLRRLLPLLGEPTNKSVRGSPGIMQEQNINDVMSKAAINNFMGDDMRLYIILVLSEQRGLNLRNRVSHGLMKESDFNQRNSDLIFNILLSLGKIRSIEKPAGSDDVGTRYK